MQNKITRPQLVCPKCGNTDLKLIKPDFHNNELWCIKEIDGKPCLTIVKHLRKNPIPR